MGRFDGTKFDGTAIATQNQIKELCEKLERACHNLKDGRAKALALTKLEEFYTWVGKALRDEQIERNQTENIIRGKV